MLLRLVNLLLIALLFSSMRLGAAAPRTFTAAEINRYASQIAPLVAGRSLSFPERQAIEVGGLSAFTEILRSWTQSPLFPRVARSMISELTRTGGKSDSYDPELPANLAEYIAREKLSYSTLLTAGSCYNNKLQPIPCDSGAPYTAGLLTTRAYLKAHASRFNLSRATSLMEEFLCKGYPMEDSFQPRDSMDSLIPLFARDPNSPETNFNSLGFGRSHCYSCHGQFSAHTQLFVRFDSLGLYKGDADGQQNVERQPGESGKSTSLLYTSHFRDPARSGLESSQMLGMPVANLADAAKVLVASDAFISCSVRRTIAYGARLERNQVNRINEADIAEIVKELSELSPNPSFAELFYTALKHPRVIAAVLRNT